MTATWADTSVPPSGHMPKGGFYFDSICRQGALDEDNLNVQDNLEEFGPLPQRSEYVKPAEAPSPGGWSIGGTPWKRSGQRCASVK